MFKESVPFSAVKGGLIAFFCFVIGIVLFSGVITFLYVGTNTVKIINQFIKIISVFFGCLFAIDKEKGLIKGALIGLVFSVFSMVFCLFIYSEAFVFGKACVDALFISVISAIIGLIIINAKN
ncbi:MAG: YrzE family protein [Clostridia bacterium]|nr:YrzE family protein [Clostridia bacterium]